MSSRSGEGFRRSEIGWRVKLLTNPQLTLAEPSRAIANGFPSRTTNCPFFGAAPVSQEKAENSEGLLPDVSQSRRKTARSLARIRRNDCRPAPALIREPDSKFRVVFRFKMRSDRTSANDVKIGQNKPIGTVRRTDQTSCAKLVRHDVQFVLRRFQISPSRKFPAKKTSMPWIDSFAFFRRLFHSSNTDDGWLGLFDDPDNRLFKRRGGVLRHADGAGPAANDQPHDKPKAFVSKSKID